MLHKTIPIALAIIVSWVVWGYMKRIPTVRRALDGALLRVPVWGKLHRYRSLSRFLSLLDHLYSAGITPFTAWDAACVSPRNSAIAEKLKLARRESSATGIADLALLTGVLEPEDVGLISAGEKTGQIPEIVSKLAEMYALKAESQKTLGRMWSVSLVTAAQLAIGGVGMILMAKSYAGVLLKLMSGIG